MLASKIFDTAIMIMDEQSDSGSTQWADTVEYQNRTVNILNGLIQECYPYSDTYSNSGKGRPIASAITALTDDVDLDDYICATVLPYGLAAHLALEDNPTVASFAQQRYEELLTKAKNSLPSDWETPTDVYGIITTAHNLDGRW